MKNFKQLVCLGLMNLIAVGAFASSKDFLAVLKKNEVQYITESKQYQAAMHSLLAKNWVLGGSSLHVYFKADPKAEKRPDFSELVLKKVTDTSNLLPEEIGVIAGDPYGRIYAGPFLAGQGERQYVFVVSVDDRPWGYDHNRYFVLFRKLKSVDSAQATEVESIPYSSASKIKAQAFYAVPTGYQPLSAEGKKILTQASNQKWARSVSYDMKSGWSDKIFKNTWKHEFHFEFWNDFKNMNYAAKMNEPNGESNAGPFERLQNVFTIGERLVAVGVHEYAIMAGNTWALFQSENRAVFFVAKEDFFGAKSAEEATAILEKKVACNYCFDGYDCSKADAYWTKEYTPGATYQADVGMLVIRVDESNPRSLQVRFELTDPRYEGLTNIFQAE